MNNLEIFPPSKPPGIDLDDLLRPDLAFGRPMDVVNDPDLTLHEKRAILASWASDARAVESAPSLRSGTAGQRVLIDDVLSALRALDRKRVAGLMPGFERNCAEALSRKREERRGLDDNGI